MGCECRRETLVMADVVADRGRVVGMHTAMDDRRVPNDRLVGAWDQMHLRSWVSCLHTRQDRAQRNAKQGLDRCSQEIPGSPMIADHLDDWQASRHCPDAEVDRVPVVGRDVMVVIVLAAAVVERMDSCDDAVDQCFRKEDKDPAVGHANWSDSPSPFWYRIARESKRMMMVEERIAQ